MSRLRLFGPTLLACMFGQVVCLAQGGPKASYRITGTAVSSRDDAPIPYCRMQIVESTQARPMQAGPRVPVGKVDLRSRRQDPVEVDADAHGRFQIMVGHPGAFVLTGSARDFRRQNYDEHEGFFSSIVLTPAAPVAEISFRMERDASIAGLVLDEAGEPVRNAQVVAEAPGPLDQRPGLRPGRGGAGRQAGFAQTDDRGRYELSGLTPGAYRVRVTAQPWYAQGVRFGRPASAGPSPDPSLDVVYPVTWYPGVQEDASAEALKLSGGEARQADFHLSPTASVHLVLPRTEPAAGPDGVVRPQRGAFVTRVSPAGGGFIQTSATNGDTQEFGGLSPGLYEIHTTGPDGRATPDTKQFRVLPGTSGVVDLSTARALCKVTLQFEGVEAAEAGQITFVDPASGQTVIPEGDFGARRRKDGDADRERIVYLAAGPWEVHVPSFASTYLTGLEAKGANVTGSIVTVGQESATLMLHLGSGRGEISGMALSAGKPAVGAMVLLVPATLGEPGNVAEVQRDQTNTDGSFTLQALVPGKYILLAIDHGWAVKWRDLATLAGYLAKGTPIEVQQNAKLQRNVDSLQP